MLSDIAHTDIAVIGSGAAGLMAALAAAVAGNSVIVIEKSDKVGGTTAFSGSLLWVPMNPLGEEVSFRDNRQKAVDYICETAGGKVDLSVVEAFVDSASETIKFLQKHTDIDFINTPYPDTFVEAQGGVKAGRHLEPNYYPLQSLGKAKKRLRPAASPGLFTSRDLLANNFVAGLHKMIKKNIHRLIWRLLTNKRCGGNALIAGLFKACLKNNVKFLYKTTGKELIFSEDKKRVIGITCHTNDNTIQIQAQKAVFLANGGFEQNPQMTSTYLGVPLSHLPTPPKLAEGDNISLAQQAGARLSRMSTFWNWPSSYVPGSKYEGHDIGVLMVGERTLPHSIWVNSKGKRFCNEAAHNVAFAFETKNDSGELENQPAWAIMDSQYRRKYPISFKLMPGGKDPAWLIKAKSLDELAQKINIEAKGLVSTIKDFNLMAQKGKDTDFGRGNNLYERTLGDNFFTHPNLGALETGPFYAVPVYASAVGTRGGAATDKNGRLLTESGSAIEGIYGSGNAVACFFGPNIMAGGATIMPAMTFAHRAIQHITRQT